MSRYNTGTVTAPRLSAIKSSATPAVNHQGGNGYLRDLKSELFLSASTSLMVNKFYETESELRDRQRQIVRALAVIEPEWMLNFVTWLRSGGNLRTGALVLAADTVHSRLEQCETSHPGINRKMISAVLQRPDEPGEMLAYWVSTYGRNIPKPVKRGVGDAVQRLYTERSFLKYDSPARAYRFGDVLELTHPNLKGWRGDLASYAISARHNRDELEVPESLRMIRKNRELRAHKVEVQDRLNSGDWFGESMGIPSFGELIQECGLTWEDVPSIVDGPWTAQLWEEVIPSMGVMALVRNLRNFDEAGIRPHAVDKVKRRITDPESLRKSKILPMRLLTAYKQVTNVRWAEPLEQALDVTLENVPSLPGRTLILVDASLSMFDGLSDRSKLCYAEVAGMFGSALALRANDPTLVHFGTSSKEIVVPKGGSVLPMMREIQGMGGTNTAEAIRKHFRGHDRVVLLTDEQDGYNAYGWRQHEKPSDVVPQDVPLITFNLAGYEVGGASGPNRMTFSSLSDSAWALIDQWGNSSTKWPWE